MLGSTTSTWASMSPEALLAIGTLNVSRGQAHVLQDVSLTMGRKPLSIVGRNGMGKTTLCQALMGLLPIRSGTITLGGRAIAGRRPFQVARAGIGYVPQGRRIFPSLSVHEHLSLVAAGQSPAWTVARVYDAFPRLADRRRNGGNELSGGEQQTLAIARAPAEPEAAGDGRTRPTRVNFRARQRRNRAEPPSNRSLLLQHALDVGHAHHNHPSSRKRRGQDQAHDAEQGAEHGLR